MIEYTPSAREHVRQLVAHYRKRQRPEAIRNLLATLAHVEATIEAGVGRPRDFPATYRGLARPGRVWLKDAIYRIAYEQSEPPRIVAVFWEGADMIRRYPEAP